MAFLKRWFSRGGEAADAPQTGDENLPGSSVRRRNFQNLSPTAGDAAVPEPKELRASQPPKAERKPRAPKKAETATKAVKESVSVVLRRQVPVRFDEEARSWLGGLPKMPAGTEWPRAKPKKPMHFVAQLDCASLPHELWGGLGPREGWLLLFVDIEAIDEQSRRPIARVLHVPDLRPETEPPAGLYFARRDTVDDGRLPGALPGSQRRHFRKWPVELVPTAADTSKLTGSDLYGAPENDLILTASGGFPMDRPMTWRGAYTILAGLVQRHNANGFESNWLGNSLGLLDYPEPDARDFNRDWAERRQRLPEWNGPGFHEADARLRAQMYEERRKGWTKRAFKVLDEELAIDAGKLADYRAKVSAAKARGDEKWAQDNEHWIEYFDEKIAKHYENRSYLEELFAQHPSEDALVAEINRAGRAHVEWAHRSHEQLRAMLDQAGTMDLDAPIAPGDWDDIAAQIASMKSVYWQKTTDTQLLRKIESGISYASLLSDAVREELLDRYALHPSSADGLDPETIANLEPRLRNLECDRPHKLGGLIDSVYDDPLQKNHVLLFQLASDAATGWIFGDLGVIYVSIHPSDLEAGSFDKAKAWLEA